MSRGGAVTGVFISYRRSELSARAVAGRLRDRLAAAFGNDHVFLDTEDIPAGMPFLDRIDERTVEGTLVLALIGPDWPLDRLQDPGDVVRREITRGLTEGAGCAAVLLDGAAMPGRAELPEELAALGTVNAFELTSGARFHEDVDHMEARLAEMGLGSGFAELFGLGHSRHYGPLIQPTLLPLVDDVVAAHDQFGGRRRQLTALDEFVGGPAFVLLVQGRSGFGKTALMAQYVHRLLRRGEPVAYQFISRVAGLAGETDTLRSLCQQLCFHHKLCGQLPHSAAELWSLYRVLIGARPPAGKLVIVIDGLDEADGWRPSENLIRGASAGIRFILSARSVAQVDWAQVLAIAPSHLYPVEVAGFGREDVAAVLSAHGVPESVVTATVDTVVTRSAGDPLYVHFLATDLAGRGVAAVDLATLPAGLEEYFHRWWKEAAAIAGVAPVRDLLGYMTAAGGKLARQELIDIAPDDALSGITFDQGALEPLQRLLAGDDTTGYEFSHPRFRDYAADRMGTADVAEYRRLLRAWCHRCASEGALSPYVLLSYPRDLAEDSQKDSRSGRELLELTRSGFLARKFRLLGSYQQIIDDLRLAQLAAERLKDPLEVLEIGLLITSVAHFVSDSPANDALPVYVALGEPDRAIDLARLIDVPWLYDAAVRDICRELAAQDAERAFRLADELNRDISTRSESFAFAYRSLVISQGPSARYEDLAMAALKAAPLSRYQVEPCCLIAEALLARGEEGAGRWLQHALGQATGLEGPQQRYLALERVARATAQLPQLDEAELLSVWEQALQALAAMGLNEWVCIPARDAVAEIARIDPDRAIAVPGWFDHAVANPVVAAETGRVLFETGRHEEARAQVTRAMRMADSLSTGKAEDYRWRPYTRALVARAVAGWDPAWALDYIDRKGLEWPVRGKARQPVPEELAWLAETWPLDTPVMARLVARAPFDGVRAALARRLAEAGDQVQADELAAEIESGSERAGTYASIARACRSREMFERATHIARDGDVAGRVFVELGRLAPSLGVPSEIADIMISRGPAPGSGTWDRRPFAEMALMAARSHRDDQARALLSLAIVGGVADDNLTAAAAAALDTLPPAHEEQSADLDLTSPASGAVLDGLRARTRSEPQRALMALSAGDAPDMDPSRAGVVAATLVEIGAAGQGLLDHLATEIARYDTIEPLDTIAFLRAVAGRLPRIALDLSRQRLARAYRGRVASAVAAEVAREDVAEATRIAEKAVTALVNTDEWDQVHGLLQICEDTWAWSPAWASRLFDQGLTLGRADPDSAALRIAEAAKVYAVHHSQADRTRALMCEAIDLMAATPNSNRKMTLEELAHGLSHASEEIVRDVFFYLVSRAAWLSGGASDRLLNAGLEEILHIVALLEPDRQVLKSRLEQSLMRSSATARSLFEQPRTAQRGREAGLQGS